MFSNILSSPSLSLITLSTFSGESNVSYNDTWIIWHLNNQKILLYLSLPIFSLLFSPIFFPFNQRFCCWMVALLDWSRFIPQAVDFTQMASVFFFPFSNKSHSWLRLIWGLLSIGKWHCSHRPLIKAWVKMLIASVCGQILFMPAH